MQMFNMEVQLWDKDILSSNDYLSRYAFRAHEIYGLIMDCVANEKSAMYKLPGDPRKDHKFEVTTEKNASRPNTKPSIILMTMECLTEAEAAIRPAGVGRGDPN